MVNGIIAEIFNPLIYLMFGAALVVFLWGMFEFIRGLSGGEKGEGREDGKRHMIWGIIGLFIMVAVYGIMNILLGTINAVMGS